MNKIEQLIQSANTLPQIPLQSSSEHQNHLLEMAAYVDDVLSANPEINELIGNNPLKVMYDNHQHHVAFMATVFTVGNYSLLARTLPWVYRAYHAHKFSYDYFPLELKTWISAAEKYLSEEDVGPIRTIYSWMIGNHENIIQLSEQDMALDMPIDANWLETKNLFRSAILNSDHKTCLKIAEQAVRTSEEIEGFYLNVLQPVLYEIGILWERAEISVAQEHLASAIVCRVMASANLVARQDAVSCGRAVVAASANELHEIGASMISDILEHDGWNVAFLGGNVPKSDLLQYLQEFKPELLALSATIPLSIGLLMETISAIRQDEALQDIKVIVGGRIFNDNPELWQHVGADGFAAHLGEVRELANRWRVQIQ